MGLTQILEQPYQNPKFPSEAFFEGLLWRVISPSTQIIWWPITYSWKSLWVSYLTHFVSPHSEFGRRSYAHFRKICPARNANFQWPKLLFTRLIFFLSVGRFFFQRAYVISYIPLVQFLSLKHIPLYNPPFKKVKNLELGLGLKVVSSSIFLGNLNKGMVTLDPWLSFLQGVH